LPPVGALAAAAALPVSSNRIAGRPQRGQRFPSQRAKKPAPNQPDDQQRSEQQDGIDALSALTFPVHILKIQPKREFIQSQGGAYTIQKGHGASGPSRARALIGSNLKQPTVTHNEKEQNSPNQMVNMLAADLEVVKGPPARANAMCEQSNDRKCQEERDSGHQLAFAMAIADVFPVQLANPLPSSPDEAGKDNECEYSCRKNEKRKPCGVESLHTAGYAIEEPERVGCSTSWPGMCEAGPPGRGAKWRFCDRLG